MDAELTRPVLRAIGAAAVAALAILCAVAAQPFIARAGASALLHPARRRVSRAAPAGCTEAAVAGEGVRLAAWRCATAAPPRGTIVYLHGIADNRTSALGVVDRFRSRGFAVVAYDSCAHGESEGDVCTYGYLEKQDLGRVLDAIDGGPIVLIGSSLGAAVAVQEAAGDPRVTALVAAETFSDLRTVAAERAPFFFTASTIRDGFRMAGARGGFDVDEVSPLRAAPRITVPVLIVHGADDLDTRPDHSRRVFDALGGPKRLVIVPGAVHNGSLRADVWRTVEDWIDQYVPPSDGHDPRSGSQ